MHRHLTDTVIGKQCPICLNGVEIRSAAILIPCKHAYCIDCIRRWSDIKRNCPLCSSNFTSWFFRIDKDLRKEKLLPFAAGKAVSSILRDEGGLLRRRRAEFLDRKRLIRRTREASSLQSHGRVLPRQRSFGVPSHEGSDVIADRIKQWRASIYERMLRAVPPHPKNGCIQKIVANSGPKEMILKRIEPWIHRELQAVLGDPDPTVIVHVVTSVFISRFQKKHENVHGEDDFLTPLRPFLHERTEIFWHEVRCFAESSLSMETYDTVVEYKEVD